MAHANATLSLPLFDTAAPFSGVWAAVTKMARRVVTSQRRRRTLEQLALMDDRLLDDIGVPRATVAIELGYDPRLVKAMAGISVPR